MKKSTNSLNLILMVSSIGLLLALQGFWLVSAYERAYFDLRRETSGLFRLTVLALRDSSTSRQLIQIKSDTVRGKGGMLISRKITAHNPERDSVVRTEEPAQIKVFITGTRAIPDSISSISIIKPLASRIRDGRLRFGENFTFQMNADSLSVDSIRVHYEKALANADIPTTFQIKQSSFLPPNGFRNGGRPLQRSDFERERQREIHAFSDSLHSDWVTIDPMHRYSALMLDFHGLLYKKILPQILFSFFLTAVTVTAFIILLRSLRSQQRLVTMKNDFISNITHELKTPIATVSVALEALKNFNGISNPERTREYLGIAQHELNRLSVLTDKVLNTSLFDERGVKLDIEQIDLEKMAIDTVTSMSLIAEKNQATIEFTKNGSNFVIDGSFVHLNNVIYNLLDNAIKYSPVKPDIHIDLKDGGDSVSLSVRDNGLGIPEEFQDKIFEKFFRMPTGDVHTIKGYGLGLSYVESVVKAHKGKISVLSQPGNGSTFIISLPRINN